MSNIVGRNQPCPCGSGKKYKHCCFGKDTKSEASNRNIIVWGGALVVVFIGLYVVFSNDGATPGFRSDPTGQGLPGQVWSPEHGHWHDATGTASDSIPNLLTPVDPISSTPFTPQPGPAPPGRFWSTEHGHWHDSTGAATNDPIPNSQTASDSLQLTPQPPGPVPDGKVWSPEHGHWHNAAATAAQAQPPRPDAIPNWDPRADTVQVTSQPPDSAPF